MNEQNKNDRLKDRNGSGDASEIDPADLDIESSIDVPDDWDDSWVSTHAGESDRCNEHLDESESCIESVPNETVRDPSEWDDELLNNIATFSTPTPPPGYVPPSNDRAQGNH